jgi:hypothetical protein
MLAALQHEQFCTHNSMKRSDNGWACYVTDTLQMRKSNVSSVYDLNAPVCSCLVDLMPCLVVVS